MEDGNFEEAESRYKTILSQKVKSSSAYTSAKERLETLKKKRKSG